MREYEAIKGGYKISFMAHHWNNAVDLAIRFFTIGYPWAKGEIKLKHIPKSRLTEVSDERDY